MTLQDQVIELRKQGKTYGEIQKLLGKRIAKSTLSFWCQHVPLPPEYEKRVNELIFNGLTKSRASALAKKQQVREEKHQQLVHDYAFVKDLLKDKNTALVALAMLCLGEASKSNNLYLGSSDKRIIHLFLELLKRCIDFHPEKLRCTIQCRADQNIVELEAYWMKITGIPKRQFYKTRIDPRTVGKPTLNENYKGVLKVDYFDSQVQKMLLVLYNLLAESI